HLRGRSALPRDAPVREPHPAAARPGGRQRLRHESARTAALGSSPPFKPRGLMVESQASAPSSLRDSGITGVANTMPTDPLHEAREPERRAKSAPRPALIFVGSRDALDHHRYLKRAFAGGDRGSLAPPQRSAARRAA